jgi:pimeloyl-ACP methyl ester carboxylesterase
MVEMRMERIQIAARGLVFDALLAGPEDGELIVLLHGLPRNCWEWHHQIPAMAELGFRVVAPDLRGFCAGARPLEVEAYHIQEYVDDTLAIAGEIGGADCQFHLMGTSIGATMAWRLAALNPERVLTLACLNIPHQGAFFEAALASKANASDQRERFSYFNDSSKAGNEREMFHRMLEKQGLPKEETEPYREALDSEEALQAVYNYYRAIPLWQRDRLPKCPMPTLYVWPPESANISPVAAELNGGQVTGPYRFEVLEGVHQPILQAAPEKLTSLLVEHLATHALK